MIHKRHDKLPPTLAGRHTLGQWSVALRELTHCFGIRWQLAELNGVRASVSVVQTSSFAAFLARAAAQPSILALLLVGHAVAWTAYACIAQSSGAVHHDMTEAWSWGQEFQLGYYKHPPL